jgi:hypothetical protein
MKVTPMHEWWQSYFDPDWIKIFSYKNQDTRREVNSIVKLLGLPTGSSILISAWNGRISIARPGTDKSNRIGLFRFFA